MTTFSRLFLETEDYDVITDFSIEFSPTFSNVMCVDISLTRDNIIENMEDFQVVIDRDNADNAVIFSNFVSTIIVTDSSSKSEIYNCGG